MSDEEFSDEGEASSPTSGFAFPPPPPRSNSSIDGSNQEATSPRGYLSPRQGADGRSNTGKSLPLPPALPELGQVPEQIKATQVQKSVPPPSFSKAKSQVRALYDFTSDDPREVPFIGGDIIEVVKENETGWWEGINTRTGQQGLFPFNYTEEITGDAPMSPQSASFSEQTADSSQPVSDADKLKRSRIREGFMTKQGHVVRNWKMRWFVLRRDEMLYYKSELDPKASGSIEINKHTTVELAGRPHSFIVTSPGRKLICTAKDAREMEEWIGDIRLVIQEHQQKAQR